MTQDELKMVLEFVESINLGSRSASVEQQRKAITAINEALAQTNEFNPDWDAMAVMVEEQQRMAKRIEELEAMLERQTARIVDLQDEIRNLTGEE